jgi:hypothetical protein
MDFKRFVETKMRFLSPSGNHACLRVININKGEVFPDGLFYVPSALIEDVASHVFARCPGGGVRALKGSPC